MNLSCFQLMLSEQIQVKHYENDKRNLAPKLQIIYCLIRQ